MRKMQKEIDDWVTQYKIGYWTPHEILARLTEEVGELAREINPHTFLQGIKPRRKNLYDAHVSLQATGYFGKVWG